MFRHRLFAGFAIAVILAHLLPTTTSLAKKSENPARILGNAFADAVETAMPAVVVIRTKAMVLDRDFHWLFGHIRIPRELAGQGSGVIIDRRGYILTNNHVIDAADEIEVVLNDGSKYDADVLGRFPMSDLAVVRLRAKAGQLPDLVPIEAADSDEIRVGEYVIAIGSPFNLDGSVTIGNISHKNRQSDLVPLAEFIQTDAAINPGNSGGPLVDVDGRLVGINTMIQTGGPFEQSYAGVGFAIPANMAMRIARNLIEGKSVERVWIGILPREFNAPGMGLYVWEVFENTPAARAGLLPGDIINSIDANPLSSIANLQREIFNKSPGETVSLGITRDGHKIEIELPVEIMPEN